MEQQSHLQGELEPCEVNRRFSEVHKPSADAWLMWKTDIYATTLWPGWFLLNTVICLSEIQEGKAKESIWDWHKGNICFQSLAHYAPLFRAPSQPLNKTQARLPGR